MIETCIQPNITKDARIALRNKLREIKHEKHEIVRKNMSPRQICEGAIKKLKLASGLVANISAVHNYFEERGDETVAINLADHFSLKDDCIKKGYENHNGSIFQEYIAGILVRKGTIGTLSYGMIGPSSMTQSNAEDTDKLLKTMENDFNQNINNRKLIIRLNNLTQAQIIMSVYRRIR
jgi:hypothetical protein